MCFIATSFVRSTLLPSKLSLSSALLIPFLVLFTCIVFNLFHFSELVSKASLHAHFWPKKTSQLILKIRRTLQSPPLRFATDISTREADFEAQKGPKLGLREATHSNFYNQEMRISCPIP